MGFSLKVLDLVFGLFIDVLFVEFVNGLLLLFNSSVDSVVKVFIC